MNEASGQRRPRCAVSIDVDPIPCYYRIHALGQAPAAMRELIVDRAVPRFAELLDEKGIPATFFVVAEDIDQATRGSAGRVARDRFTELARSGHELGNHSYGHPYDLARWQHEAARSEIVRAHELIAEIAGGVRGFRAPGYDLSAAMLETLEELGYLYDSSIFPAPAYYLAKAAVMAGLRAMGRPSGAVMTEPRALVAPTVPYRPERSRPWRRGASSVIELPVAVTQRWRLPAIGTSVVLAPPWLRRRLVGAMSHAPLFNFELHGIDLLDGEDDGVASELIARQPDLRAPLARKRAALADVLDQIREHFAIDRLDRIAQDVADSTP